MNLRTLFITLVACSAFALSVPGAWAMSDASDRTVAASQPRSAPVSPFADAHERAGAAHRNRTGIAAYRDAPQRAALRAVDSSVLVGHVDRYEIDLPRDPGAAPTIRSHREIEWPQIGIGFGLGICLTGGLLLAVRLTRDRDLAH